MDASLAPMLSDCEKDDALAPRWLDDEKDDESVLSSLDYGSVVLLVHQLDDELVDE